MAGTTWGWIRAQRERDDKGKALVAEKNTQARTREALDEMSSRMIEDWLSRQPYQSPEQKAFLEKAATFYEEFAAATGDDDATLAEVADAHRRLATIYMTLRRAKKPPGRRNWRPPSSASCATAIRPTSAIRSASSWRSTNRRRVCSGLPSRRRSTRSNWRPSPLPNNSSRVLRTT